MAIEIKRRGFECGRYGPCWADQAISSASSVALIVEMKDCRLSREKVVRQGQQF